MNLNVQKVRTDASGHDGRRRGLRATVRAWRGFTLVEIVVILAVTMILATTIFSTTVRQLDRIAGNRENETLKQYVEALQQRALRTHYIPGVTNWTAVVAAELGVPAGTVGSNDRGVPRLFLPDPGMHLGRNLGGLPYQQEIGG